MSGLEAIIFDGEGVVVDTEPTWDEVQVEFLMRRNLRYDRETTKPQLTGRTLDEGTAILKRIYGIVGDTSALSAERAQLMVERLQRSVDFVPGFNTFFELVKDRYKVALATSMSRQLIELVSDALSLDVLFDGAVVSADDVHGVGKPAPDIYLEAARRLMVRPRACVAIEDSPLGVDAAHAAGMVCIGLSTTHRPSALSHADAVVGEFSEIDVGLLGRLE